MNKDIKTTIAFVSTIIILILIYFGAFLPLRKSQLYIEAIRDASQIKSVQEFNALFGKTLDFYSPIGHGEIVYAYLNVLAGIMQGQENPEIAKILLKEADKRMEPILKEDKGSSYFQSLYSYGLLYELAGNKFKNRDYFQKSAAIYEIAYKHSPGRPTLLFGLYRVYSALGDVEKVREIGKIMLKYWPEDERVKEIIQIK